MDKKSKPLMKLQLGCGKNARKGYVNLDVAKLNGVDVVHDLNKMPYPFKDNTFDYVYSDNVLEHLEDLIKTMEELNRITKKNGIIEDIVPLAPTMHAFRDPTHKLFFTYRTFEYFDEDCTLNFYSKARFKIMDRKIIFHNRLGLLTHLINSNKTFCKFLCEFFSQFFPPAFLKIKLKVQK